MRTGSMESPQRFAVARVMSLENENENEAIGACRPLLIGGHLVRHVVRALAWVRNWGGDFGAVRNNDNPCAPVYVQ